MDFATLLVSGAPPAADPSALLGVPPTASATGDAFAALFDQAMVAPPPGQEAAPVTSVLGDPAADGLVLPGTPAPTSFGISPSGVALDPSTATDGVASVEPSVASEPKPLARFHGSERTGKKTGVSMLPDCPTAPLLPDCPTALLLPSCPPAPSESPAPIEGEAPIKGGATEDTSVPENDLLDGGSLVLPAMPTATTPSPAPTITVAPTHPTVPVSAPKSFTKIDAVGNASKLSEARTPSNVAMSQAALLAAPDLGIVPQVTVSALDSEASIAIPPFLDNPAPTAPAPPASAPSASSPPVPSLSNPLSGSTVPPSAPAALNANDAASKDEIGVSAGARTDSAKGRETPLVPNAPKTAESTDAKVESKASPTEPILEAAVQDRKDDGQAPSGDHSKDAGPENVVPQFTESGVHETSATARPEAGSDRPSVDRHLVVKQVADRIENMVAARPRDGVTIHMEPHDLGTVTLVVKGLASALDVQVTASDDRVRQSLDASRSELAQALAPRGIGLREIRVDHAPSTSNPTSSTTADSGSGSSQGRSGSGSSQSQPKQNPSAFRSAAPAAPRPRASRPNGRGVDLLV